MLQEFLKYHRIINILEIGTFRGGTALLWAHIVANSGNGKVYCVDNNFKLGGFIEDGKIYKRQIYNEPEYSRYAKRIIEIEGNSHLPDFVEHVKSIVSEVSMLFIDGDHSYNGVKLDFYNYKDLVMNKGFVIFHDIVSSEYLHDDGCFVDVFWNEIKHKYKSWEFIDGNSYKYAPSNSMGIGVIQIEEDVQK
jgi:cephalosporin hydroxylase